MSDAQQFLVVFGFVMLGLGAQMYSLYRWEKSLNTFHAKLTSWHKSLIEWSDHNKQTSDNLITMIDKFQERHGLKK